MNVLLRVAMTVTLGLSSVSAFAQSLCAVHEQVIFNCQIKDSRKLVSVCASHDLAKDRGYLQYRFGTKRKLELVFPPTKIGTQQRFYWSEKRPYQSAIYELAFISGGYLYTVSAYEASAVLNDIPGGAQGGDVVVQRMGSPNFNRLNCVGYPDGQFQLLGVVRDAEDLIGAKQ
jgi:hypothetical protein